MNTEKVGLMGFNGAPGTLYGMFQHGDFYKVAVAHATQDPRMMPANFIGEYFESSEGYLNVDERLDVLAKGLRGKLLLMHDMLDACDNPVSSWRIVDALFKANKDFDMLFFPDENSGAHIGSLYAFRRTWDYFVKHLKNEEVPKEFDLSVIPGKITDKQGRA